jgi:hypothetical protein
MRELATEMPSAGLHLWGGGGGWVWFGGCGREDDAEYFIATMLQPFYIFALFVV